VFLLEISKRDLLKAFCAPLNWENDRLKYKIKNNGINRLAKCNVKLSSSFSD
jgi:hypothetical protein